MQYITHIIPFATPAYDETVRLRNEILVQPLGLSFSTKDLSLEFQHYHLACYNDREQLLGCLVLVPLTDSEMKMRQVAVDKALQKKGIGKQMVIASEIFAREQGFSQMVMNSRDRAIPFYEKLGYQKVGKPFTEVGIKHYKMIKTL